jgi:GR25 family glycosyltransferase involved in LPS biosynthesis
MKAYVINLHDRVDRWHSVTNQWNSKTHVLVRVDAVKSSDIPTSLTDFLPTPVVANWESQCKAFREFLSTDDQYALILEDDFLLNNANISRMLKLTDDAGLDFLQLGYLYNSTIDFLLIKAINFRDLLLKSLSKISLKFKSGLSQRLLLKEQEVVSFKIVMNHAGAGSHAYIISRKFAEEMLKINHPTFLAADGLFIAISGLRFLKMGRLRKNLVKQSNSPSSITERFIT